MPKLKLDGYTYRYVETIDKEGYIYVIPIEFNGRQGDLYIDNVGVIVRWEDHDGGIVNTNFRPESIFGIRKKLKKKHLKQLLINLTNVGFEGKKINAATMKDVERYLK